MALSRFGRLSGFTLLELGIVLIVLSLLAAGILAVATQNVRVNRQAELQEKLDTIEAAILAYRKEYEYLPCPGQSDLTNDEAAFGFQGATPGDCVTQIAITDPVATFSDGVNTVGGSIPVRDLNLNDEYMYDPWGNQFLYVVDKRATENATFNVKLTDTSLIGSITVSDNGNNISTSTAVLLILSFGPNGHGAYQVSGDRKYEGSINTHELENCDCTATAPGTFDAAFYIHPATTSTSGALDSFDDIGRYYSRQQLFSPTTDTLTETP